MKFMFMSEGETPIGVTHQTRYWELVDEVLHAEKWGFDSFGVSEQHFAIGSASISSPEVLYSYLFAVTSRIRFRHAITVLPKNINHPLRVAARTAVEDVMSHGRIELGTGRGVTALALRAYQVDPSKNRGEWYEGIQILQKAFTEDPFTFKGEHFDIPPRSLVPRPLQKPYPPIFGAATSEEAHRLCGELGIGVISYSNYLGWGVLERNIAAFRNASETTAAAGKYTNRTASVLVQAYCAANDRRARDEGAEGNLEWVKLALDSYPTLAKRSKDYAYMAEVETVRAKFTDFDYFVNESGSAVFGSPETCIRQIEKLQALGFNDITLRIDSVSHELIMNAIMMFGKYVIPHFRSPESIAIPAEQKLARMRQLRGSAPAKVADAPDATAKTPMG